MNSFLQYLIKVPTKPKFDKTWRIVLRMWNMLYRHWRDGWWMKRCKSRKSRDTWSNRQIWSWITKWSRAKANRVLPRERTGHSKYLFQKHKRQLYTWTSPDGQYWGQTDYILCSQRWRSSMQSAKSKIGKWLWLRSRTLYYKIQT